MKKIGFKDLKNMFLYGVNKIAENADYINELNVFPVPDGDTGTNLKITSTNAFEEVEKLDIDDIALFGQAFSRALLMNARGNSGVIFSQIIKGFVSGFHADKDFIDVETFINCFQLARNSAYQSVSNPVEGTILTIIRVVDEELFKNIDKLDSIEKVLTLVNDVAKEALDKTPDLLPQLKKVGVVDSGGYGLLMFFNGMLESLSSNTNKRITTNLQEKKQNLNSKVEELFNDHNYEEGFGYCTELIIKINSKIVPNNEKKQTFYIEQFKLETLKMGDSLVCVQDNDIVKIHIHTTKPGDLLNFAQKYGEFIKIKIENMTEQFYSRLKKDGIKVIDNIKNNPLEIRLNNKPQIVLTCPTKKIMRILQNDYGFKNILCTENKGNPSIQDILMAIQKTKSKNVIFITDDSNIVMAANQVVSILSGTINLKVCPATNIFEALIAGLEFDKNATLDNNIKAMNKVVKNSFSALVSKSVKDVDYNNISFNKNDFIGIIDKRIVVANKDEDIALKLIIDLLMNKAKKHADVLIIFYDNKKRLPILKKIEEYVNKKYDLVCEFQEGGQGIYNYYIGLQ